MRKNYQKTSASAATVPELVMPDVVSLAMADIADAAREGLLALGGERGLAGEARVDGRERHRCRWREGPA